MVSKKSKKQKQLTRQHIQQKRAAYKRKRKKWYAKLRNTNQLTAFQQRDLKRIEKEVTTPPEIKMTKAKKEIEKKVEKVTWRKKLFKKK